MHPVLTKILSSAAMTAISTLLLTGCNTVKPVDEKINPVPIVETIESSSTKLTLSEFTFPKAQLSADGEWLPYTPSTNPYDLLPAPTLGDDTVSVFSQALKDKKNTHYDTAEKALKKLTKTQPQLSGPWFQLGDIAALQQNWQDAETAYAAAIAANEWNTWAWLGLGIAQRQQGKMIDAQTTYVSALQHWPDFAEAHKNLAILLDVYLNQPEVAQPHFEAFQILTQFEDQEANDWVTEIRRRTGIERAMPVWTQTNSPETKALQPTKG